MVRNGPSIDGYFDNLTLTTNIGLPIILSAFNVTEANEIVKISWTTASQFKNNYFTVQRSENATTWKDVEKIDGSRNNSTILNYVTFDKNPMERISYYRLKQTDLDGSSLILK